MGYSIQYEAVSAKKYIVNQKSNRKKWLYMVLVLGLVVGIFFARKPLRSFLFPGDPEITDMAFERMVDTLEEGEGMYKAAQVFCREIINGAS